MKRIFSLLLTAALLVGFLSGMCLQAEAASEFKASPEQIELIKRWEGFCFKPYWDYGQWTVGYGTRAPDEHLARYRAEGISREEAEQLLTQYIDNMGKSVNSFIDKFGIKATQQQFDAMLSLTYNTGGGWMFKTCTLRTAFIEGWTGSDLLFAMGEWSNAGGSILTGLVRRRLAEASTYLDGIYDINPSANYSYVLFDANGGETNVTVQGYDVTETPAIRAVATNENLVFQGWYTDPSGGEKIEKLDAGVKGYTLYAHWAAGDGADQPQDTPEAEITGTPVSYVREVASQTLNAFQQPVKGALVVDAFYQYDLLDVVAEYTDTAGIKWGKVKNVGWVNLQYTQEPVEDDESNGITVKVITDEVNVRRGPGTAYARVGSANTGDELIITRTTTAGGYTWGKFKKGWIALKYTNYDDVVNGNTGDDSSNVPEDGANSDDSGNSSDSDSNTNNNTNNESAVKPGGAVMGTVKVSDILYIRQGAGTSNPVVGSLSNGTRVEILEQKASGGTIWGRIDRGWISLSYVTLDKAESGSNDQEKEPEKEPEKQPEKTPETAAVIGKVKLNSGKLNVRSGPSTGYGIVGGYSNGDAVTILEQKTVGKTQWGRTEKGWISLDYVVLDKAQEPEKAPETSAPEETQPEATEPEATEPEQSKPQTPESSNGNSVTGTVILSSGNLRIRGGAGTNNSIVGYYYNGDKVTITEQKTVSGTVWGKTQKGWISLDYVRLDSNGSNQAAKNGTVNVDEFLRIRGGAGTGYPLVGYYYKNDRVTITETKIVYGVTWGKTDRGWISMDYIILDGETTQKPAETPSDNQQEQNGKAATITGSDLRIRSGAGTGNAIVGVLQKGDKVTVLETKDVNGVQWGRISKGWICMDYAKYD